MPSVRHQTSTYSLHEQPEVAVGLLAATGVPLPEHDTVHVDSPKLPNLLPTDFEADAVITLVRAGEPVLSVVLEIQLGWKDDKTWVWPAYLANLRRRRRCPVYLLVICLSTRTATKCAEPIHLGHPGFVLKPLVSGPRDIPRVTDANQARATPALAVLSALAHPRDKAVLKVVPDALSPLNHGAFAGYHRLIEAALPAASRRFLEDLMRTPYKSEFANKHHAEGYDEGIVEGQARGLARAVLEILDAHRVRLTDSARRRIEECSDESQLITWLRRAADATTVEQLFA
jgi:hypothetical protein